MHEDEATKESLATAAELTARGAELCAEGRYAEALPLEERALALTEAALGRDHPDLAPCLTSVAGTLMRLERHGEAVALATRACDIVEAAAGPDARELVRFLNLRGVHQGAAGAREAALATLVRAVALAELHDGSDAPSLMPPLSNLALSLESLGRDDEALPFRRRAASIAEARLAPSDPTRLRNIRALTTLLIRLDHDAEAEAIQSRVIESLAPGTGEEARWRWERAGSRLVLARPAEAREDLERALAGASAPDAPRWLEGRVWYRLGDALRKSGQPRSAVTVLQGALSRTGDARGRRACQETLAATLAELGALDEALAILEEVARDHDLDDEETELRLAQVALTQAAAGRPTEAKAAMARALDLAERLRGPTSAGFARRLEEAGRMAMSLGEVEEAQAVLERARDLYRALGLAHARHHADCLVNLAMIAAHRGDRETALVLRRSAMSLRGHAGSRLDPQRVAELTAIADLLMALGRDGEAVGVYQQAVEAALVSCRGSKQLAIAFNNYSLLLRRMGSVSGTLPLLAEALRIAETELGPDHPITAKVRRNLAAPPPDDGWEDEPEDDEAAPDDA